MLLSAKNSDSILASKMPQNLLQDEKTIFDFVERIGRLITDMDGIKAYYSYLETYLKYNYLAPHSEAYCRRSLELIEILFNTSKLEVWFIKDYLTKTVKYLMELCLIRNKVETVKVLLKK